jgi:GNAT superfamily N-acetyltransferase
VSSPGADVSVRVAWADDATSIARVQLRAWPVMYGDLLPRDAIPTGPEAEEGAAAAWLASLEKPGDARNRVLVALERNRVVGFAITGPAGDPDRDPVGDAELRELTVDPDERRKGHGSRLLQAAADTMTADRFIHAVTWVVAADDALLAFLTGAGWGADSAHRELDLDGTGTTRVKQVRLHTRLA